MKNQEAKLLLTEIVDYYLETHEETAEVSPTHAEIERAERHIGRLLDRVGDGAILTVLSREDIEGIGYDASKLDDADLERMASKLADDYLELGYWEALQELSEVYFELPKLDRQLPEKPDSGGSIAI